MSRFTLVNPHHKKKVSRTCRTIWSVLALSIGIMLLLNGAFGALAQDEPETAACVGDGCQLVYLPLIKGPPGVLNPVVNHKVSCEATLSKSPIGDSNSIDLGSGQRQLDFSLTAAGYSGATYNSYFVIDGMEQTDFATSGTITGNRFELLSTTLFFSSMRICEKPLPAGNYAVRFFINGDLMKEVSANLQ